MPKVPDTTNFTLQDVYASVHGHSPSTAMNLQSCFTNANSSFFDSFYNNDTYDGTTAPKKGMKRFRNYTPVIADFWGVGDYGIWYYEISSNTAIVLHSGTVLGRAAYRRNNELIIVGNNGNSFKVDLSVFPAVSVTAISGLSAHDFISLQYSASLNMYITVGQGGRVYYKYPSDSTWTYASTINSGNDAYCITIVDSGVYILCQGGHIFKSTDGINYTAFVTIATPIVGNNPSAMCKKTGTNGGLPSILTVFGECVDPGNPHDLGLVDINSIGGLSYSTRTFTPIIGSTGDLYARAAAYSETYGEQIVTLIDRITSSGIWFRTSNTVYSGVPMGDNIAINGSNIYFGSFLYNGTMNATTYNSDVHCLA